MIEISTLIAWQIDSNDGTISRLADSGQLAGYIDLVSIVRVFNRTYVTAVRDINRKLKLILWGSNTLRTFNLLDDWSSGTYIDLVSAVARVENTSGEFDNKIITAIRDDDGDLKLIAWQINANNTISRLGDSGDPVNRPRKQAGAISLVSTVPLPDNKIVTAVRDTREDLMLISWRLTLMVTLVV